MAFPFYEILIRSNNGVFSGGSARATPTSQAVKIHLADWPEVCAAINVSTLARVEELEVELAAEKEARAAELATVNAERDAALAAVTATLETERAAFQDYKSAAEGALKVAGDAIADPTLDDTSTLEVVRTAVAEISKPVAQRELEKLEAEEAARAAEVEAKRQALLAALNA